MRRTPQASFVTRRHILTTLPVAAIGTGLFYALIMTVAPPSGANAHHLPWILVAMGAAMVVGLSGYLWVLGRPVCVRVGQATYDRFRVRLLEAGFEVIENTEQRVVYATPARNALMRWWAPFLQIRVMRRDGDVDLCVSLLCRHVTWRLLRLDEVLGKR